MLELFGHAAIGVECQATLIQDIDAYKLVASDGRTALFDSDVGDVAAVEAMEDVQARSAVIALIRREFGEKEQP